MADWKDNKGLGPWDFTKQPAKYGYINNPRWTTLQEARDFCSEYKLPLDPSNQHKPCGYWPKQPCSVESFFDWPEDVNAESFMRYNGERLFILQREYANGKVFVYGIDGNLITSFSTMGTNPSCMKCLAVDNDYCFVGATSNVGGPIVEAHITRFNHDGSESIHWKIGPGTYGSGPAGIFSDGRYVYATSTYGLHKFTRSGTLIWEHPYRDTGYGTGNFWIAYGLWSDENYIFLVDYSSSRLIKYSCSSGGFIREVSIMVPASPSSITVDNDYVYICRGWGVCMYHKKSLGFICCATFDNYAYRIHVSLAALAYDGQYWWALSNHTTIVKFDTFIYGASTSGNMAKSRVPLVWPMPE